MAYKEPLYPLLHCSCCQLPAHFISQSRRADALSLPGLSRASTLLGPTTLLRALLVVAESMLGERHSRKDGSSI